MYNIFPDNDWQPEQPDPSKKLWRYIDFAQFVSILETESLWFSSVAEFFDPFEGALPEEVLVNLADSLPQGVDDPHKIVSIQYDALRYMTYANCWHQRDEETAAMWELYRSKGKEVAIQTTVGEFNSALPTDLSVTTGCVNYDNYDSSEGFIVTRTSPFFQKRPSFEHEREYRAVFSNFEVADGARIDSDYVHKIDQQTPPGKPVSVSLNNLIQEVIVSPLVGGWMERLADNLIERYGVEDVNVRPSNIEKDPFQYQTNPR